MALFALMALRMATPSAETPLLTPRAVTFRYRTDQPRETVVVVGQFNQWDRASHPLVPNAVRTEWTGTFPITPGVYQFLFCLDNREWRPDPALPTIGDGNGNTNNLLTVQPAAYDAKPGQRGDGLITSSALLHRPDRSDRYRRTRTSAYVRFRTRVGDVGQVSVRIGGRAYRGQVVESDPLFDHWQINVPVRKGRTPFEFLVTDGDTTVQVGPFAEDFSVWPLPEVPAWVADAVFYQIFPDRFANGDPSNDPADVLPWGSTPRGQTEWMGGDIAGIRKNLDAIQALGVNAIYLNPIFRAVHNHAYDTIDYRQLDPRFGTNEEFRAFVQECHRRGIRVMLDAVFNHTSPQFFAFQDLVNRGEKSRYKDWYFPLKFPIEVREGQQTYRTFAGVPGMPKLNTENPEVERYLIEVGRFWIEYAGIDGWRLDVADEVSHQFWRRFRTEMKRTKPDVYICGEVWGDAHEWLQGDEHDGVMNYRVRRVLLDFLALRKITAAEAAKQLNRIYSDVSPAVHLGMFNVMGSHDTERLATIADANPGSLPLLFAAQLALPGAPSLYYGDELELRGGKEPASRQTYPWERASERTTARNVWDSMIQMRREREELRRGNVRFVSRGGSLGIVRTLARKKERRTALWLNPADNTWRLDN